MINKKPFENKILFFDIETDFLLTANFHIGRKVSITHNQLYKDVNVICISYMAEGWKKPKTLSWEPKLSPDEIREALSKDRGFRKNLLDLAFNYHDDTHVLSQFREIADNYDVLIAQNGDRFDIPILNGIAWKRGLRPFTNIQTLDTLKFSRQNMKLTSHTLDYKLKVMGKEGKYKTTFANWRGAFEDTPGALKEMCTYCEYDVIGLRDAFWSLLPYVDPRKLPISLSVLLTGDREGCPTCGSFDRYRNGVRPSKAGLRQRWVCKGCGADWTDVRLKTTTDKIEEKK